MLELTGLAGGYGQAAVVRSTDLTVRGGEITALIGRNGAGKTTLLRTVFGLADRHGGSVTLDGRILPPGRPELLARAGATLMPEDRGVFPALTVAENLRLARRHDGVPAVDPYTVFPLLTDRARQPAGTLSGGQKQQLGIARAMLAGRTLIAVDELTQGLQPSVVADVLEALGTIASAGVAVLLVDQHAGALLDHSRHVVAIEAGRVVLDAANEPGLRDRLDDILAVS